MALRNGVLTTLCPKTDCGIFAQFMNNAGKAVHRSQQGLLKCKKEIG